METDHNPTEVLERPSPAEKPSKPPRDPMQVLRMVRGILGLALIVGVATVILLWAGSLLRTTLVEAGVPTRPPPGEEAVVASASTAPPSTAAPGLPEGLTCEQLADNGLEYSRVVAYWIRGGSPEGLGDAKPCTDVYDEGEIDAFFEQGEGQSSKATCQDLSDDGLDYPAVVAYFLRRDRPKRLDPDADGLPCTDVYSRAAVEAYVHFDRQPVSAAPTR